MPYQVYAEWADTRTNGKAQGIAYNHTNYTDGFYQHGYPLAHALGGDAQMISVGGDIRIAFNDEIKASDLTWSHYIRPEMPLKINAWIGDSQVKGRDSGVSLGIEIPLEKGLFSY